MDIKRYGFDYRIAEVMPMLEEMQLYGTKALIRDLKTVVDEIQEIRAKAIDGFAEKLSLEVSESIIWDMLATMSKNSSLSDTSDEIVDYVINTANEIAERLKVGGENEND